MATQVMWRCTACGKWSHARRRPKEHRRFVHRGAVDTEPDPDIVLDEDPGDYDHLNGDTREGGWIVRCGPFERWLAVRTDRHTRPVEERRGA